ncbi:MAG TPA: site-specific integrase [Candidatus Acidoferrum sp.]|nr:site-specific integrase [Candidatus Acidoferrum sp.]
MRGLGTIFRQRNSRFFWMQYFVDGRRVRESTKCDRLKAAQDVLKNKLLEIQQQGGTSGSAPATIANLYTLIENDYTKNGRKSIVHLRGLWNNHLSAFFAGLSTTKLSAEQIDTYVRRRLDDGAANASINRELSALKRMYKLALKSGRLKTMPFIAMLKERNVRSGFVKDADYQALARETAKVGIWLRGLFEVAYTYGFRKSELTTMRVRQVDLKEGTIELNPGETKSDEGRAVELTESVRQVLAQCIAGKSPDELVFTRVDGSPAGNFRRVWNRACTAAGSPGLLFHDLRRSGVRNMRRAGISEKVAMGISGHKTRSVFERYNIVDPADLKEAAAKIEQGAEKRAAEGAAGISPAPAPPEGTQTAAMASS